MTFKTSNTKISKDQKAELRDMLEMLADAGGAIFSDVDTGITVAFQPVFPGAKMSYMAVSFASVDEKKIRVKVGQFNALMKLDSTETVTVPVNPANYEHFADEFMDAVQAYR